MIEYCRHRSLLPALVQACRQLRPLVNWPDVAPGVPRESRVQVYGCDSVVAPRLRLIGRARLYFFHQQGEAAVYEATTAGGEDAPFRLTQQLHEQPGSQATGVEGLDGLPAAAIIVAAAGNSNTAMSFPDADH